MKSLERMEGCSATKNVSGKRVQTHDRAWYERREKGTRRRWGYGNVLGRLYIPREPVAKKWKPYDKRKTMLVHLRLLLVLS